MELLCVVIGAVVASVCITWGCILHMRYLDRKLLPPPAKPAKPALNVPKENA